jgi:hypothetical protein
MTFDLKGLGLTTRVDETARTGTLWVDDAASTGAHSVGQVHCALGDVVSIAWKMSERVTAP